MSEQNPFISQEHVTSDQDISKAFLPNQQLGY